MALAGQVLVILALVAMLVGPARAIAQDEGSPEPGDAPASVEVPVEQPEASVVEDEPVEPEIQDTDQAAEPAADEPVEETAESPVTEPEAPVEDLAVEQAPEPQPLPILSYAVSPTPACVLAADQPSAVAHGQNIDYTCTDTMSISGSDVIPGNVGLTWDVQASVGGGWSVSLLPPVNDPSVETRQWTPPGTDTAFSFTQHFPLGAGADRTEIETTVEIGYRLRVQRATCSDTAQAIQLAHDISLFDTTPGASVTMLPRETWPATVSPALQPIPKPSVAFDGPLAFGDVGVTASGPENPSRSGRVSLTVANLDAACGTWNLVVSASGLVDGDGEAMQGSHLMVVSVNDEPIPGDACDLAAGCDIVALLAGPNAASPQTVVLGVELRMPEQPGLGVFGTALDASLVPSPGG